MRTGSREGLVFGSTASSPFTPSNIRRRAATRWEYANKERAKLELPPIPSIGLHEARHCYVSWLYDAGIAGERVSDYAGHAVGGITDRYRHTLAGRLETDVKTMDAYLTAEFAGASSGAQAVNTA
jgi:integrase